MMHEAEAPVPFRSMPVRRIGGYNVKTSISDGPMYVIVYWKGRPEEEFWLEDSRRSLDLVKTFDDEEKAKAFLSRLADEVDTAE